MALLGSNKSTSTQTSAGTASSSAKTTSGSAQAARRKADAVARIANATATQKVTTSTTQNNLTSTASTFKTATSASTTDNVTTERPSFMSFFHKAVDDEEERRREALLAAQRAEESATGVSVAQQNATTYTPVQQQIQQAKEGKRDTILKQIETATYAYTGTLRGQTDAEYHTNLYSDFNFDKSTIKNLKKNGTAHIYNYRTGEYVDVTYEEYQKLAGTAAGSSSDSLFANLTSRYTADEIDKMFEEAEAKGVRLIQITDPATGETQQVTLNAWTTAKQVAEKNGTAESGGSGGNYANPIDIDKATLEKAYAENADAANMLQSLGMSEQDWAWMEENFPEYLETFDADALLETKRFLFGVKGYMGDVTAANLSYEELLYLASDEGQADKKSKEGLISAWVNGTMTGDEILSQIMAQGYVYSTDQTFTAEQIMQHANGTLEKGIYDVVAGEYVDDIEYHQRAMEYVDLYGEDFETKFWAINLGQDDYMYLDKETGSWYTEEAMNTAAQIYEENLQKYTDNLELIDSTLEHLDYLAKEEIKDFETNYLNSLDENTQVTYKWLTDGSKQVVTSDSYGVTDISKRASKGYGIHLDQGVLDDFTVSADGKSITYYDEYGHKVTYDPLISDKPIMEDSGIVYDSSGEAHLSFSGAVTAFSQKLESIRDTISNTTVEYYKQKAEEAEAAGNYAAAQNYYQTMGAQGSLARVTDDVADINRTLGTAAMNVLNGNMGTIAYMERLINGDETGSTAWRLSATLGLSSQTASALLNTAEEDRSEWGKFWLEALESSAEQIPERIMGVLTGGTTLPMMAFRVFGQSATEAWMDDQSLTTQFVYAMKSSAIEVLTEVMSGIGGKIMGGVSKGAIDSIADQFIDYLVAKGASREVLKYCMSGASEGFEEVVASVLNYCFDSAALKVTGNDFWEPEAISAGSLFMDFLGGAASCVFSGPVEKVRNTIATQDSKTAFTEYWTQIVKERMLNSESYNPDTEAMLDKTVAEVVESMWESRQNKEEALREFDERAGELTSEQQKAMLMSLSVDNTINNLKLNIDYLKTQGEETTDLEAKLKSYQELAGQLKAFVNTPYQFTKEERMAYNEAVNTANDNVHDERVKLAEIKTEKWQEGITEVEALKKAKAAHDERVKTQENVVKQAEARLTKAKQNRKLSHNQRAYRAIMAKTARIFSGNYTSEQYEAGKALAMNEEKWNQLSEQLKNDQAGWDLRRGLAQIKAKAKKTGVKSNAAQEEVQAKVNAENEQHEEKMRKIKEEEQKGVAEQAEKAKAEKQAAEKHEEQLEEVTDAIAKQTELIPLSDEGKAVKEKFTQLRDKIRHINDMLKNNPKKAMDELIRQANEVKEFIEEIKAGIDKATIEGESDELIEGLNQLLRENEQKAIGIEQQIQALEDKYGEATKEFDEVATEKEKAELLEEYGIVREQYFSELEKALNIPELQKDFEEISKLLEENAEAEANQQEALNNAVSPTEANAIIETDLERRRTAVTAEERKAVNAAERNVEQAKKTAENARGLLTRARAKLAGRIILPGESNLAELSLTRETERQNRENARRAEIEDNIAKSNPKTIKTNIEKIVRTALKTSAKSLDTTEKQRAARQLRAAIRDFSKFDAGSEEVDALREALLFAQAQGIVVDEDNKNIAPEMVDMLDEFLPALKNYSKYTAELQKFDESRERYLISDEEKASLKEQIKEYENALKIAENRVAQEEKKLEDAKKALEKKRGEVRENLVALRKQAMDLQRQLNAARNAMNEVMTSYEHFDELEARTNAERKRHEEALREIATQDEKAKAISEEYKKLVALENKLINFINQISSGQFKIDAVNGNINIADIKEMIKLTSEYYEESTTIGRNQYVDIDLPDMNVDQIVEAIETLQSNANADVTTSDYEAAVEAINQKVSNKLDVTSEITDFEATINALEDRLTDLNVEEAEITAALRAIARNAEPTVDNRNLFDRAVDAIKGIPGKIAETQQAAYDEKYMTEKQKAEPAKENDVDAKVKILNDRLEKIAEERAKITAQIEKSRETGDKYFARIAAQNASTDIQEILAGRRFGDFEGRIQELLNQIEEQRRNLEEAKTYGRVLTEGERLAERTVDIIDKNGYTQQYRYADLSVEERRKVEAREATRRYWNSVYNTQNELTEAQAEVKSLEGVNRDAIFKIRETLASLNSRKAEILRGISLKTRNEALNKASANLAAAQNRQKTLQKDLLNARELYTGAMNSVAAVYAMGSSAVGNVFNSNDMNILADQIQDMETELDEVAKQINEYGDEVARLFAETPVEDINEELNAIEKQIRDANEHLENLERPANEAKAKQQAAEDKLKKLLEDRYLYSNTITDEDVRDWMEKDENLGTINAEFQRLAKELLAEKETKKAQETADAVKKAGGRALGVSKENQRRRINEMTMESIESGLTTSEIEDLYDQAIINVVRDNLEEIREFKVAEQMEALEFQVVSMLADPTDATAIDRIISLIKTERETDVTLLYDTVGKIMQKAILEVNPNALANFTKQGKSDEKVLKDMFDLFKSLHVYDVTHKEAAQAPEKVDAAAVARSQIDELSKEIRRLQVKYDKAKKQSRKDALKKQINEKNAQLEIMIAEAKKNGFLITPEMAQEKFTEARNVVSDAMPILKAGQTYSTTVGKHTITIENRPYNVEENGETVTYDNYILKSDGKIKNASSDYNDTIKSLQTYMNRVRGGERSTQKAEVVETETLNETSDERLNIMRIYESIKEDTRKAKKATTEQAAVSAETLRGTLVAKAQKTLRDAQETLLKAKNDVDFQEQVVAHIQDNIDNGTPQEKRALRVIRKQDIENRLAEVKAQAEAETNVQVDLYKKISKLKAENSTLKTQQEMLEEGRELAISDNEQERDKGIEMLKNAHLADPQAEARRNENNAEISKLQTQLDESTGKANTLRKEAEDLQLEKSNIEFAEEEQKKDAEGNIVEELPVSEAQKIAEKAGTDKKALDDAKKKLAELKDTEAAAELAVDEAEKGVVRAVEESDPEIAEAKKTAEEKRAAVNSARDVLDRARVNLAAAQSEDLVTQTNKVIADVSKATVNADEAHAKLATTEKLAKKSPTEKNKALLEEDREAAKKADAELDVAKKASDELKKKIEDVNETLKNGTTQAEKDFALALREANKAEEEYQKTRQEFYKKFLTSGDNVAVANIAINIAMNKDEKLKDMSLYEKAEFAGNIREEIAKALYDGRLAEGAENRTVMVEAMNALGFMVLGEDVVPFSGVTTTKDTTRIETAQDLLKAVTDGRVMCYNGKYIPVAGSNTYINFDAINEQQNRFVSELEARVKGLKVDEVARAALEKEITNISAVIASNPTNTGHIYSTLTAIERLIDQYQDNADKFVTDKEQEALEKVAYQKVLSWQDAVLDALDDIDFDSVNDGQATIMGLQAKATIIATQWTYAKREEINAEIKAFTKTILGLLDAAGTKSGVDYRRNIARFLPGMFNFNILSNAAQASTAEKALTQYLDYFTPESGVFRRAYHDVEFPDGTLHNLEIRALTKADNDENHMILVDTTTTRKVVAYGSSISGLLKVAKGNGNEFLMPNITFGTKIDVNKMVSKHPEDVMYDGKHWGGITITPDMLWDRNDEGKWVIPKENEWMTAGNSPFKDIMGIDNGVADTQGFFINITKLIGATWNATANEELRAKARSVVPLGGEKLVDNYGHAIDVNNPATPFQIVQAVQNYDIKMEDGTVFNPVWENFKKWLADGIMMYNPNTGKYEHYTGFTQTAGGMRSGTVVFINDDSYKAHEKELNAGLYGEQLVKSTPQYDENGNLIGAEAILQKLDDGTMGYKGMANIAKVETPRGTLFTPSSRREDYMSQYMVINDQILRIWTALSKTQNDPFGTLTQADVESKKLGEVFNGLFPQFKEITDGVGITNLTITEKRYDENGKQYEEEVGRTEQIRSDLYGMKGLMIGMAEWKKLMKEGLSVAWKDANGNDMTKDIMTGAAEYAEKYGNIITDENGEQCMELEWSTLKEWYKQDDSGKWIPDTQKMAAYATKWNATHDDDYKINVELNADGTDLANPKELGDFDGIKKSGLKVRHYADGRTQVSLMDIWGEYHDIDELDANGNERWRGWVFASAQKMAKYHNNATDYYDAVDGYHVRGINKDNTFGITLEELESQLLSDHELRDAIPYDVAALAEQGYTELLEDREHYFGYDWKSSAQFLRMAESWGQKAADAMVQQGAKAVNSIKHDLMTQLKILTEQNDEFDPLNQNYHLVARGDYLSDLIDKVEKAKEDMVAGKINVKQTVNSWAHPDAFSILSYMLAPSVDARMEYMMGVKNPDGYLNPAKKVETNKDAGYTLDIDDLDYEYDEKGNKSPAKFEWKRDEEGNKIARIYKKFVPANTITADGKVIENKNTKVGAKIHWKNGTIEGTVTKADHTSELPENVKQFRLIDDSIKKKLTEKNGTVEGYYITFEVAGTTEAAQRRVTDDIKEHYYIAGEIASNRNNVAGEAYKENYPYITITRSPTNKPDAIQVRKLADVNYLEACAKASGIRTDEIVFAWNDYLPYHLDADNDGDTYAEFRDMTLTKAIADTIEGKARYILDENGNKTGDIICEFPLDFYHAKGGNTNNLYTPQAVKDAFGENVVDANGNQVTEFRMNQQAFADAVVAALTPPTNIGQVDKTLDLVRSAVYDPNDPYRDAELRAAFTNLYAQTYIIAIDYVKTRYFPAELVERLKECERLLCDPELNPMAARVVQLFKNDYDAKKTEKIWDDAAGEFRNKPTEFNTNYKKYLQYQEAIKNGSYTYKKKDGTSVTIGAEKALELRNIMIKKYVLGWGWQASPKDGKREAGKNVFGAESYTEGRRGHYNVTAGEQTKVAEGELPKNKNLLARHFEDNVVKMSSYDPFMYDVSHSKFMRAFDRNNVESNKANYDFVKTYNEEHKSEWTIEDQKRCTLPKNLKYFANTAEMAKLRQSFHKDLTDFGKLWFSNHLSFKAGNDQRWQTGGKEMLDFINKICKKYGLDIDDFVDMVNIVIYFEGGTGKGGDARDANGVKILKNEKERGTLPSYLTHFKPFKDLMALHMAEYAYAEGTIDAEYLNADEKTLRKDISKHNKLLWNMNAYQNSNEYQLSELEEGLRKRNKMYQALILKNADRTRRDAKAAFMTFSVKTMEDVIRWYYGEQIDDVKKREDENNADYAERVNRAIFGMATTDDRGREQIYELIGELAVEQSAQLTAADPEHVTESDKRRTRKRLAKQSERVRGTATGKSADKSGKSYRESSNRYDGKPSGKSTDKKSKWAVNPAMLKAMKKDGVTLGKFLKKWDGTAKDAVKQIQPKNWRKYTKCKINIRLDMPNVVKVAQINGKDNVCCTYAGNIFYTPNAGKDNIVHEWAHLYMNEALMTAARKDTTVNKYVNDNFKAYLAIANNNHCNYEAYGEDADAMVCQDMLCDLFAGINVGFSVDEFETARTALFKFIDDNRDLRDFKKNFQSKSNYSLKRTVFSANDEMDAAQKIMEDVTTRYHIDSDEDFDKLSSAEWNNFAAEFKSELNKVYSKAESLEFFGEFMSYVYETMTNKETLDTVLALVEGRRAQENLAEAENEQEKEKATNEGKQETTQKVEEPTVKQESEESAPPVYEDETLGEGEENEAEVSKNTIETIKAGREVTKLQNKLLAENKLFQNEVTGVKDDVEYMTIATGEGGEALYNMYLAKPVQEKVNRMVADDLATRILKYGHAETFTNEELKAIYAHQIRNLSSFGIMPITKIKDDDGTLYYKPAEADILGATNYDEDFEFDDSQVYSEPDFETAQKVEALFNTKDIKSEVLDEFYPKNFMTFASANDTGRMNRSFQSLKQLAMSTDISENFVNAKLKELVLNTMQNKGMTRDQAITELKKSKNSEYLELKRAQKQLYNLCALAQEAVRGKRTLVEFAREYDALKPANKATINSYLWDAHISEELNRLADEAKPWYLTKDENFLEEDDKMRQLTGFAADLTNVMQKFTYRTRIRMHFMNTSNDLIQEVNQNKPSKIIGEDPISKAANSWLNHTSNFQTFCTRLAGGLRDSNWGKLAEAALQRDVKHTEVKEKAKKLFKQDITANEMDEFNDLAAGKQKVNIGGQEITLDQALCLALQHKSDLESNKGNRELTHVYNRGFYYAEIGKNGEERWGTGNKLAHRAAIDREQACIDLEDLWTDATNGEYGTLVKNIVRNTYDVMRYYSPLVGKEYQNMYGLNITEESGEYYFGLLGVSQSKNINDKQTALSDASFLKARTGPSSALKATSLVRAVDSYITKASRFIAFGQLGESLDAMTSESAYMGNIYGTLQDAYSNTEVEFLKEFIACMKGTSTKQDSFMQDVLGLLRAAQSTSVIVGGLNIGIIQRASYVTAARNYYITDPNTKKEVNIGINIGTLLANMSFGKKGNLMNRDVYAIYADDGMLLERTGVNYGEDVLGKGLWPKIQNKLNKTAIGNFFVNFINWNDQSTVAGIVTAADATIRTWNEKNNKGLTEDQIRKMTRELYSKAIVYTQPFNGVTTKAWNLRTNNEAERMFSMFRTVQEGVFNSCYQQVLEYKATPDKEHRENLSKALTGAFLSAVLLAGLRAFSAYVRRDDDDYTDEEGNWDIGQFLKRMGLDTIEGVASYFWLSSSFVELAIDGISRATGDSTSEFYGFTTGSMSLLDNMYNAITNLFDYGQTPLSTWKVAKYIGQVAGIPLNAFYSWINTAVMWGADVAGFDDILAEKGITWSDDMLTLFTAISKYNNKTQEEKDEMTAAVAIAAKADGDTETYDRLMSTISVTTDVQKYITDKEWKAMKEAYDDDETITTALETYNVSNTAAKKVYASGVAVDPLDAVTIASNFVNESGNIDKAKLAEYAISLKNNNPNRYALLKNLYVSLFSDEEDAYKAWDKVEYGVTDKTYESVKDFVGSVHMTEMNSEQIAGSFLDSITKARNAVKMGGMGNAHWDEMQTNGITTEEQAYEVVKNADKDNDGKISEDEAQSYYRNHPEAGAFLKEYLYGDEDEATATEKWTKLASYLSNSEYKLYLQTVGQGEMSAEQFKAKLRSADLKKDGNLVQDDVISYLNNYASEDDLEFWHKYWQAKGWSESNWNKKVTLGK